VGALRRFEPGESAGYGRSWRAERPTWVATIPIGYGDGWRRGLSNNADVLIRGRRHPLVGTISMDNITVALGDGTDVEVGDEVVLIGSQGGERILAEEVARRLGTINYEVTCGLSRRVRREHFR
jgi:alanine racemase